MFGIRKGLRRLAGREAKPSPKPSTTPRPTAASAPAKAAPVNAPANASTSEKAAPSTNNIAAALSAQTEAQQRPTPPTSDAKKSSGSISGIAAMIAAGAVDDAENEIDLSVSYTSGPAAEAAARAMAERDMLNTADDGTEYWGPVDNESSRAKADGLELVIDQEECIHCGTCVENTEQVFVLPDDSKAVVIAQEGPMELIQDAIDACPVTCIHWTDDPEQYPQTNDAEGQPI